MSSIWYEIFLLLGSILRMLGLFVLGLGMGWFVLESFRKGQQTWQLQAAIFLGFTGLIFGLAYIMASDAPAAIGLFGAGVGVAMLVWGLPKNKKETK